MAKLQVDLKDPVIRPFRKLVLDGEEVIARYCRGARCICDASDLRHHGEVNNLRTKIGVRCP